MVDINFNQLKIFCTVAESKNYKEASEKLFVGESTISEHIIKLEKKYNHKLFYREKDGIILTPFGNDLYNSIHSQMKNIEHAISTLIQNYDISKSTLKIGCPSHISTFYLSKCIKRVKKEYPDIKVDIIGAADYASLINLLQNHTVDFLIMDINPTELKNEIKVEKIKDINNIFVSKFPIQIVDIKDLEKYNFILNYENSISTKELYKVLEKYNVKINSDLHADITEMRIEAVKEEQGIGYVMREAVQEMIDNKELYEVKLPIERPEMKINIIYMEKYLTEMDKIFINKYLKK